MGNIQLPRDFEACERGETWLHNEDGNHHLLIVELSNGTKQGAYLLTEIIPDNYPGFHQWVRAITEQDLATFDLEKALVAWLKEEPAYKGWNVRRSNLEGLVTGQSI